MSSVDGKSNDQKQSTSISDKEVNSNKATHEKEITNVLDSIEVVTQAGMSKSNSGWPGPYANGGGEANQNNETNRESGSTRGSSSEKGALSDRRHDGSHIRAARETDVMDQKIRIEDTNNDTTAPTLETSSEHAAEG
jgi:hypothetical protein